MTSRTSVSVESQSVTLVYRSVRGPSRLGVTLCWSLGRRLLDRRWNSSTGDLLRSVVDGSALYGFVS